ncbi:ABC transporter transmembrane domain-containing protein [Flexivirga caeni]|uniref:ABC transporter transmembrane domain-containing protein n=1 Tax=Flexivirga caeni TaxID=2294115 RepID=UPI001C65C8B4
MLGTAALAVGMSEAILWFIRRWLVSRATMGVERDIREDLYARLQVLPMSFHNQWQSGQLRSRIMNDLSTARQYLSFGIVRWLTWYNTKRRHSRCAYKTPNDYEADCTATLSRALQSTSVSNNRSQGPRARRLPNGGPVSPGDFPNPACSDPIPKSGSTVQPTSAHPRRCDGSATQARRESDPAGRRRTPAPT